MLKAMDHRCLHGEPTTSLTGVLNAATKDLLKSRMRDVPGLPRGFISRRKGELIDWFLEYDPFDVDFFCNIIYGLRAEAVRDIQRIVEAGGYLTIPREEIGRTGGAWLLFPAAVAFRAGDAYVFVTPDELLPRLRNLDWDTLFARVSALDKAIDCISRACDFRGIIELGEAVDEALPLVEGTFTRFELIRHVEYRDTGRYVSYYVAEAPGRRGTYVMSQDFDLASIRDDMAETSPDELLLRQQGKPVRPVADMPADTTIANYLLRCDSTRAFMAYFDAHVPRGMDDYTFARQVLEAAVSCSHIEENLQHFFAHLFCLGLNLTDAQVTRIAQLYLNLFNDIPLWSNNGWSPRELSDLMPELKGRDLEIKQIQI